MGSIRAFVSASRKAVFALCAIAVVGCGGGSGSDGAEQVPPTPLPQAMALNVPPTQQELGTLVAFSSNVIDLASRLTYLWSFGDGTTSTLAAPSHAYAKTGEYSVKLTVTNEASESRTSEGMVSIADLAVVKGKTCNRGEGLGWCWQRPLPQGNAINDAVFLDDVRGWAVGDSGTILATTDGGVTWKAQVSGTQSSLYQVRFADAQVGWVAGSYGQVLRTVDGGATWQSFSIGRSSSIQSVGSTSANEAWVTTYSGYFATKDGGAHWQPIPSPSLYYWQILAVSSVSDLWATSYISSQPSVVHSSDGGLTWTSTSIPPAPSGFSRSGVRMHFKTPQLGVFMADEYGYIGNSYISRTVAWQTSDAGASWQRLNLATIGSIYGSTAQVVAPNVTFLMSNGPTLLRRSTDLGATWQSISLPQTTGYWYSYRAYSASRVTLTDSRGRMFLTTDGGATWADRSAGSVSLPMIDSIRFFDSREGLALGTDGSSIRTTDGGQSWTTTAPLSNSYGWQRAQFSASGNVGWVAAWSTIYRSTDRGKTWLAPVPETSAQLPYTVADFHFVDERNGWAIARYAYQNEILFRSSDGGMSWQPVANTQDLVGSSAVRFADAFNGVVVGVPGVAWVTADGGSSWIARPTGVSSSLLRAAFAGATTVVAVGTGGTIVRSTDRGFTWTRAGSPTVNDLNDIRFVTSSLGYAAGDAGTLLKTVDGGLTWTVQDTSTNQALHSVYFQDEKTGWTSGSNGAILATASGGR